MRNPVGLMVAFASLVMIPGTAGAVEGEPAPALVASVRGCAQAGVLACRELAVDLAKRLKGIAATDGSLALRLGTVAADAVERPEGMVAGVAESCRLGYRQACVTLARVLDRLFTGDDARLERSTDRLLARDLAAQVMVASSNAMVSLKSREAVPSGKGGKRR